MIVAGILSLVSAHFYEKMETTTFLAIEEVSLMTIRLGLEGYFVDPRRGQRRRYPPELDHAKPGACTPQNRCFDSVVKKGLRRDWVKLEVHKYRSPVSATNEWTYFPEKGVFLKTRD